MFPIITPKSCIITVPITLCKLSFVQIYEEVSGQDILSYDKVRGPDPLGVDLLNVLRDKRLFYNNKFKFQQNLLEMLALSGLDIEVDVMNFEVDWLINGILHELRNIGALGAPLLPFNSMQPIGGDGFIFINVNHADLCYD